MNRTTTRAVVACAGLALAATSCGRTSAPTVTAGPSAAPTHAPFSQQPADDTALLPFQTPDGFTAAKPMSYVNEQTGERVLSYSFTTESKVVEGGIESQLNVALIDPASGATDDLSTDARTIVGRDDVVVGDVGGKPVAVVETYSKASGAEFGVPDRATSLYMFRSNGFIVQVFVSQEKRTDAEALIKSFDDQTAQAAMSTVPGGAS